MTSDFLIAKSTDMKNSKKKKERKETGIFCK